MGSDVTIAGCHINTFKVGGLLVRMKEMNLFLVGVVLLFGFAGFVCAEAGGVNVSLENDTNFSIENNTVVNSSLEDDFSSSNETNESVVLNEAPLDENQTGRAAEVDESDENVGTEDEEVAEDLMIDDVVVEEEKSVFDVIVSYASDVVARINVIHENLTLVILIVLWVLSLLVYSIFYDTSSARVCFSKAFSLHRKATIAHVNGNYAKAKKLYSKSYLLREKGEGMALGESNDSTA